MLALKHCNKLGYFEAFPLKNNLIQYIEALPYLKKIAIPFYDEFVYKSCFEPALEKAVYALLKRSYKGPAVLRYYMNRIIGHSEKKKIYKVVQA